MLNIKELVDADLAGRKVSKEHYAKLLAAAGNLEMVFIESFFELGVNVVGATSDTLSEDLVRNLARAALDEVLSGRSQISEAAFRKMWDA